MAVEEPDWADVLKLIQEGLIRAPEKMEQYALLRSKGTEHFAAAASVGWKKFESHIQRRRLIDGFEKCIQLMAQREPASVEG